MKQYDDIFLTKKKVGDFRFGKSVVSVFDDMVGRSVPFYAEMQRMITEIALDFALGVLNDRGGFLTKVFQGDGFDAFLKEVRCHFKKVMIRKPDASRGRSREVYILARNCF